MKLEIILEARTFFYSFALGACVVALYDIFRIIRVIKSGRTLFVATQDILYLTAAGAMLLWFVFAQNRGMFRYYILFGTVAGGFIYYLTISRFFFGFAKKIVLRLKKLLQKTLKKMAKPLKFVLTLLKMRFRIINVRKLRKKHKKSLAYKAKRRGNHEKKKTRKPH